VHGEILAAAGAFDQPAAPKLEHGAEGHQWQGLEYGLFFSKGFVDDTLRCRMYARVCYGAEPMGELGVQVCRSGSATKSWCQARSGLRAVNHHA